MHQSRQLQDSISTHTVAKIPFIDDACRAFSTTIVQQKTQTHTLSQLGVLRDT